MPIAAIVQQSASWSGGVAFVRQRLIHAKETGGSKENRWILLLLLIGYSCV